MQQNLSTASENRWMGTKPVSSCTVTATCPGIHSHAQGGTCCPTSNFLQTTQSSLCSDIKTQMGLRAVKRHLHCWSVKVLSSHLPALPHWSLIAAAERVLCG